MTIIPPEPTVPADFSAPRAAPAAAGLSATLTFWPPADELQDAAERIRATLGEWPASSRPWRFCLLPPESASPSASAGSADSVRSVDSANVEDPRTAGRDLASDVIILTGAHPRDVPGEVPARWQEWQARGAAIMDVSETATVLLMDGVRYALSGERSDDWLPALAAFVDCDFALHDALCLALAWRGPGAFDMPDMPDMPDTPDSGVSNRPGAQDTTAPVNEAATPVSHHWPDDIATFPSVLGLPVLDRPFPRCPDALGLYPLVPDAHWVERLVKLGVRTLQLRLKSTDTAFLRAEIARAVAAARQAPEEVRLFINDHWQLAIDAGAYGVHLGQEDLQTADLKAIAASGLHLGLSTHGYYEILVALQMRPSYIACGAIFPTTTKTIATPPQGAARLAAYVRLLNGVMPVVAIGGIDADTLPEVLKTGVRSAAVVRAVTEARDLEQGVSALLRAFIA